MPQHINVLLDSRTGIELKLLHDRLREVRSEAIANNVYGSSMQVNLTMRACSDYMDHYVKGALEDYKRVVRVDPGRFKRNRLEDFESVFLLRLNEEAKNIRDILEAAVGGMIKHHGDLDGKWMRNYDEPSSLALKWATSEVALVNMQVVHSKPNFATTFKDWYEDKAPLVLLMYGIAWAAALATVKGAYDIVASFIG